MHGYIYLKIIGMAVTSIVNTCRFSSQPIGDRLGLQSKFVTDFVTLVVLIA